jgi:trk system potassium uptake protein TrkA
VKAVIAGAGIVGVFLANHLSQAGHEVLVIEESPELVATLALKRPGVRWLCGDGCEYSTLADAGVGEADVVVAATGDDEDNLVISLLAKQEFAVPRVVARVNHPKNHWMFNQTWGVDVSVSTPHLLSAVVEEAVTVGSLVRLLQLNASGARLVEVTLTDASPAAGRAISELGMPRDATIVAIVRRANVVVPRGDSIMEAGDEVVALVTPAAEDEVRRLLAGGAFAGLDPDED